MNEGPLFNLIKVVSSLPGLGQRSARRMVLYMLTRREKVMRPLVHALERAAEEVRECSQCGNLDMCDPCTICQDTRRSDAQICIIAQISDLWAIERTSVYQGRYHVLGGLLSALDGIGPEQLRIDKLLQRIESGEVSEVILALSATVDGQSTAHFIADQLQGTGVKISRLAHGLPVGGELDYLDDGTITTALRSRNVA